MKRINIAMRIISLFFISVLLLCGSTAAADRGQNYTWGSIGYGDYM